MMIMMSRTVSIVDTASGQDQNGRREEEVPTS